MIQKFCNRSILLIFGFLMFPFAKSFAQQDRLPEQSIVHLLDYVAMDYPMSVNQGKILNEQEYQEQLEFSSQIYQLTKESQKLTKNKEVILEQIRKLQQLISQKKSGQDVQVAAGHIKDQIIREAGIAVAPKVWPNAENGAKIYANQCATCHGMTGKGDGPLAKGLQPTPTHFIDEFLMKKVSPFHAYNSIKLGVPGTAMRAFSELSDQQIWDLAFYVKTLALQTKVGSTKDLQRQFDKIYPEVNLTEISTLSDTDLLNALAQKTKNPDQALMALRLLKPSKEQQENSLNLAKEYLISALTFYKNGDRTSARSKALNAYLEGVEPVETRLRAANPDFVADLEQQMMAVRQSIDKQASYSDVRLQVDKALALIQQSEGILHGQKLNYGLTFIMAVSIMLREGLEAFLVLAVVLALIKSSGVKKALPWVHGGWISAVLLGIAGWFLSGYIISFGGKNREIMEGLVSLLAVVVLLSVGFWLHNNSYAKQWKHFIEHKIGKLLKRENMIGLSVFSFMVVFREVFEIILFLQAINLEAEPQNKSAIGFGVLAAIFLILLIAYFFLKYSKMIPVRKLFLYSSWIVVFLAFILVGKGVHSLQESGWIAVTSVAHFYRIDWLGMYPSVQTILSQLGLLVVILMTYFFYNQKRKKSELSQNR